MLTSEHEFVHISRSWAAPLQLPHFVSLTFSEPRRPSALVRCVSHEIFKNELHFPAEKMQTNITTKIS
jgi:hypothetical protein